MKGLFVITAAALALAACSRGSSPQQNVAASQIQTINSAPARPVVDQAPPMLQDEAPPPKPKVQPWETPKVVVLTPEDEKVRSSLPFSPAIAMDPIDGSKISIRANTPMLEYKGKFYYFSSEANRQAFASNPASFVKEGFTKL